MFCSFHFYLCLTSPFKACYEIKNSSATTQEGRVRKLKRLQIVKTKTKECDQSQKSLTPLFFLPFAACTEIVYMIDNRLSKFSSLAI